MRVIRGRDMIGGLMERALSEMPLPDLIQHHCAGIIQIPDESHTADWYGLVSSDSHLADDRDIPAGFVRAGWANYGEAGQAASYPVPHIVLLQPLAIWHELAHLLHYALNFPPLEYYLGAPVTSYANKNAREYFAEMIAAFILRRSDHTYARRELEREYTFKYTHTLSFDQRAFCEALYAGWVPREADWMRGFGWRWQRDKPVMIA